MRLICGDPLSYAASDEGAKCPAEVAGVRIAQQVSDLRHRHVCRAQIMLGLFQSDGTQQVLEGKVMLASQVPLQRAFVTMEISRDFLDGWSSAREERADDDADLIR